MKNKIKDVYIKRKKECKRLGLKEENLNKYNILIRSIKERRKLKILYYSFDSGENERIIEPAEMFLIQDSWYCVAYCELRHDIRHFELNRIINIKVLNDKF